MAKDHSCFTQIIDYNFKDLVYRYSPKLVLIIAPGLPTSIPNFCQVEALVCELEQPSVGKDEEELRTKKRKKHKSLTPISEKSLCDFLNVICILP